MRAMRMASCGRLPDAAVIAAPAQRVEQVLAEVLDVGEHLLDVVALDEVRQVRAAVAQLRHPGPELVPGIDLRKRCRALRHGHPGEHRGTLLRRGLGKSQQISQRLVVSDKPGGTHGFRIKTGIEDTRKAGIAVVEGDCGFVTAGHGGHAGNIITDSTLSTHLYKTLLMSFWQEGWMFQIIFK